MIRNKIGLGLLIINIIILTLSFLIFYVIGEEISILHNQIEVYQESVKAESNIIKIELKKIATSTVETGRTINKEIEKMQESADRLAKLIHPNIVKNIESIKKANLLILNMTRGCTGSGTHIRIKNQDYILSVAHLIDDENDILWAIGDNKEKYNLSIVKYNEATDLALFKINKACPELPYLEISEEFPIEGSEVLIIGNPAGETDIVTEGIIAKVDSLHYTVTNLVYYGNSGGALLYKGKIIGVVSQLDCKIKPPVYVNYGKCVNLTIIKEFLKEI